MAGDMRGSDNTTTTSIKSLIYVSQTSTRTSALALSQSPCGTPLWWSFSSSTATLSTAKSHSARLPAMPNVCQPTKCQSCPDRHAGRAGGALAELDEFNCKWCEIVGAPGFF